MLFYEGMGYPAGLEMQDFDKRLSSKKEIINT